MSGENVRAASDFESDVALVREALRGRPRCDGESEDAYTGFQDLAALDRLEAEVLRLSAEVERAREAHRRLRDALGVLAKGIDEPWGGELSRVLNEHDDWFATEKPGEGRGRDS